jgi:glycerophosphoryl diester phosphodiesterase
MSAVNSPNFFEGEERPIVRFYRGKLHLAVLVLLIIVAPRTEMPLASADPLIIAHRGASGLRPEHTLAAYGLAIAQGADFIEVDIVPARDGALIARHENELSDTTDIASKAEFSDRRTTKLIDGVRRSGWFAEDFTVEELRRLRAVERLPQLRPGNRTFDGLDGIPTLEAVIALIHRESRARGTPVGLYVETKHPTYFRSVGLPLEERVVEVLRHNGYRTAADLVYLESFEPSSLRRLKELTNVRLVQLIGAPGARPYDFAARGDSRTYDDLLTPAGLAEIATYSSAIGVTKEWLQPSAAVEGDSGAFIPEAHQQGLHVHVWTLRNENYFLPPDLRVGHPGQEEFPRQWGNAVQEYHRYVDLGIDGVFTDFPGTARQALTDRP